MKFFKRIKGQIELIPITEPYFHPQIDPAAREAEMGKWLFSQILLCNLEGSILVGVSEEESANLIHPQIEETAVGWVGKN